MRRGGRGSDGCDNGSGVKVAVAWTKARNEPRVWLRADTRSFPGREAAIMLPGFECRTWKLVGCTVEKDGADVAGTCVALMIPVAEHGSTACTGVSATVTGPASCKSHSIAKACIERSILLESICFALSRLLEPRLALRDLRASHNDSKSCARLLFTGQQRVHCNAPGR